MKWRMLLPLMLKDSKLTGSLFFTVILTGFKCVFMLMSTPNASKTSDIRTTQKRKTCKIHLALPATVPWTTVPFFSSIVTVSLLSFIKNLLSERVSYDKCAREMRALNRRYWGRVYVIIGCLLKMKDPYCVVIVEVSQKYSDANSFQRIRIT